MGMDKYNSHAHGEVISMVKKAIEKKNISVNGIAIGEKFVNKKEKIENNFLFVSCLISKFNLVM